jgi:putative ABC transport system ATP-binding protein
MNIFLVTNREIENHVKMLLNKYNLEKIYNKYIFFTLLSSLVKESVIWSVIYMTEYLKKYPEMYMKFVYIIITLYILSIPITKHYHFLKNNFLKKIIDSNTNYYMNNLLKLDKKELLNFNFNKYFNHLFNLRYDFERYILLQKHESDIPVRITTIFVYALVKKNFYILLIFLILLVVKFSNNIQYNTTIKNNSNMIDIYDNEDDIKKYMLNSKLFIVNSELNRNYIDFILEKYNKNLEEININNSKSEMNVMIIIFFSILLIVSLNCSNNNEKTSTNFLLTAFIIYDFEYIMESVNNYHVLIKRNVDFELRIKSLNELIINVKKDKYDSSKKNKDENFLINEKIEHIVINSLKNDKPYLNIIEKIHLNKGECVLIDGVSGSGKTTLFYILKGIIKPDSIDIKPELEKVNKRSFLNLTSNKSIYSGKIYDIVSNYEKNINKELFDFSIRNAKLEHLNFNENKYINIEELSAGEQARLVLARNIYIIKKEDRYDLLLFDEVDDNLNDKLSIEIYKNIKEVFKDKIMLYITHNQSVKNEFERKIIITNNLLPLV